MKQIIILNCDDVDVLTLTETALCEAMWNATHGNDSFEMTTMSTPAEMTTVASLNGSACEIGAAEGNCASEQFALLCPKECYNLTCNDTGIIYKHPVLRYHGEIPDICFKYVK
jgi:hypothetical protein